MGKEYILIFPQPKFSISFHLNVGKTTVILAVLVTLLSIEIEILSYHFIVFVESHLCAAQYSGSY